MIARRKLTIACLLAILAMPHGAMAQTGASASSSAEILLRIPELVRISGLQDIELEWQAASNRFYGDNQLCVYRNDRDGNYSVVASSNNGGGNGFTLVNESSQVPYRVHWNGQTLNDGLGSGVLSGADTTSSSCSGNGNIDLVVDVTLDDSLQASQPGEHRDTLTLTVVAE